MRICRVLFYMECKIFIRRLFAFHSFQVAFGASGTAAIELLIEKVSVVNFWNQGACDPDQRSQLSDALALWISVPSSDVEVSSCINTGRLTSTSTTTSPLTSSVSLTPSSVSETLSARTLSTSFPLTTSVQTTGSEGTRSTTVSMSDSRQTFSTSSSLTWTVSTSESTTTLTSGTEATSGWTSTTSVLTTSRLPSTIATTAWLSSTPDPLTSASTTWISSSMWTGETSTKAPSVCPPIPPPGNPGNYTTAESNAYCISAEGRGSYCKCAQIPAGQLCQSIAGGYGLNCNCSLMCPVRSPRRLLSYEASLLSDTAVTFGVSSDSSMNEILNSLTGDSNIFKVAMGYDASVNVSLISFLYKPSAMDRKTASQVGTVYAIIDFETPQVSTSLRRLSQTNISLSEAVAQSVSELVPLPKGSEVGCIIQGVHTVTANVSVKVPSDLDKSTNALALFLQSDVKAGGGQLPVTVSSKTGNPVAYSQGYVPVVWSVVAVVIISSVVLPYVLAGVGAACMLLGLLIYRNRFVIRSRWDEFVDFVRMKRQYFGSSSWTNGRFLARFPETDKLEISSTPDTATNFDDDEFDEMILRNLRTIPQSHS